MPRVQMPDGKLVTIPDGADPDEITTAYLQRNPGANLPSGSLPPGVTAPIPAGLQGPPQASALSRFGSSALAAVNPVPALKEAYRIGTTGTPKEQRDYALSQFPSPGPAAGLVAPAVQAGKQALGGDYAGAAGTLTGSYGPMLAGEAAQIPAVHTAGRGAVGAIRGGAEGMASAKGTTPMMAGGFLGSLIHGREGAEIGAGIGALPATIAGAVRGAREAMRPSTLPPMTAAIPPVRYNPRPVSTETLPTTPPPGIPEVPPPGTIGSGEHGAIRRTQENVTNKVHGIADYLFSNGIRPETLDLMTPAQRLQAAQAAGPYRTGIEGDTLRLVKQELQKRHSATP